MWRKTIMNNETLLQKSIDDLNEFYKNSLYIERKNKANSKHLFGHRLFKKCESIPFNAFVMSTIAIALIVGYFYLNSIGVLLFNFLTASLYIAGLSTLPLVILSNTMYHINRLSSGKIGRTYTRMGFDLYFQIINQNLRTKYKSLFECKELNEKSKQKFLQFAELLEGYASNMNFRYAKLQNRVKKFNAKKQAKWQPVLEVAEQYSKYLKANSEKFSAYAQNLKLGYTENSDFQFSQIKEFVNDSKPTLIYQEDLKNTSNFELFKKYILRKKQLQKQRLQQFDDKFNL